MTVSKGMIGVFGGTFDPPHLGHLILAEEARYQLNLEKVLWVLTPVSPLKPDADITPVNIRLDLLGAAINGNPGFEVSRVDVDRSAPYYAFETLRILSETYSRENLIYLMGGDSLRDLPRWRNPSELTRYCHSIAVMHRSEDELDLKELEPLIPDIQRKVQWVNAPLIEISSTAIRTRLIRGEPVKYFLTKAVYEIIKDNDFYQ